ncbi:MAG TPA: N-acyl homoserine lactonase family protein [Spirochaetota bacterium]|nr:N-acyl homoserine lactonase family protein [Spirochaetota bacterium]
MNTKFIRLLIIFIFLTALSTKCFSGGQGLKIYALRYGKSTFQNRFVFYGDKSGGTVPFSWMFYYIEYGDKKILIDTGFNDSKMSKMFGITDFKDPVAILDEKGIKADRITDVIITHSHFDHIGNAHRFKNARFIINKDELAELNKGKSLGDVKNFLNSSSKVTVFDESTVLYDMFTIKKVGGHTKGSSVVFFNYNNEEYCFTGDEVYLRDNITRNTGNGSVVNHSNNIGFIDLIRKGNYKLFIFHDNKYAEMKERFIKVFPAD